MANSSPKRTSSPARPPQAVKFGRRTSSGRLLNFSRDDDMDMSGDFSGNNDYVNYTVLMPPTPDNQPMDSTGAAASSDSKPDTTGPYGVPTRVGMTRRVGNDVQEGAAMDGKMDRRMSVMLRSQTGDFDHNRWLFETKGTYGIGNAMWSKDDEQYGSDGGMSMNDFLDKPWKPLTRKLLVPAGILSPYRCTPRLCCLYIYIFSHDLR